MEQEESFSSLEKTYCLDNRLLGKNGVCPGVLQEFKGEIAVLLLMMHNFSFKVFLVPRIRGLLIQCWCLERT